MERSYLLKIDGKVVERPQHMLMRVSIGIHGEDVDAAIEVFINNLYIKLLLLLLPNMCFFSFFLQYVDNTVPVGSLRTSYAMIPDLQSSE